MGRRLFQPGTFDIDGRSPCAWGHDGRPRTRDVSPLGTIGTRPRGMSPPVPQSMGIGDVGWSGMEKMVVQRSLVWVMWREPPRDSMRCWAWMRPSWDEVAVLVGWSGSMGLVHMHSMVSLSVSMVRVAVLEGGVYLAALLMSSAMMRTSCWRRPGPMLGLSSRSVP